MSFIKFAGEHRTVEWYPKTTSTAIALNSLVYLTSGALAQSASSIQQVGVAMRAVVSTDSDYATSGAKIPVEICLPDDIYLVDVIGGSAAASNIGGKYDIDSTFLGVNLNGTTYKQILVVGIVSTTQVLAKIIGINQYNLS